MELRIKVICSDLPGTEFDDEAKGLHYRNVHLGIQRGENVIETVSGDSGKAEFEPVFRVAPLGGSGPEMTILPALLLKARGSKDFFIYAGVSCRKTVSSECFAARKYTSAIFPGSKSKKL
jgi:hypothetical protein